MEGARIDAARALWRAVMVVVVALLALSACTPNRDADFAIQRFQQRDFVGARDELVALEPEQAQMSDRWRTRYQVYRGLSHFRVWRDTSAEAERQAAAFWLARGLRTYESVNREFLSIAEEREARRALACADDPRKCG